MPTTLLLAFIALSLVLSIVFLAACVLSGRFRDESDYESWIIEGDAATKNGEPVLDVRTWH